MSLSIFSEVACCTRNTGVRVDKQKRAFKKKLWKEL